MISCRASGFEYGQSSGDLGRNWPSPTPMEEWGESDEGSGFLNNESIGGKRKGMRIYKNPKTATRVWQDGEVP